MFQSFKPTESSKIEEEEQRADHEKGTELYSVSREAQSDAWDYVRNFILQNPDYSSIAQVGMYLDNLLKPWNNLTKDMKYLAKDVFSMIGAPPLSLPKAELHQWM